MPATFREFAPQYQTAGFTPVPWLALKGGKRPIAKGYLEDSPPVHEWINRWPDAQVGIVSHGWLGIDVDAAEHGGKSGDETIRDLSKALGALPETISSTARGDDSLSRIYFFSIPEDDRRYRDVGKDVESIRPGHRFAAVYPSVHPNGGTYQWYDKAGVPLNSVPSRFEFAPLPQPWIEYLTAPTKKDRGGFDGSVSDWLDSLVPGDYDETVRWKLDNLRAMSFGHDTLVRSVVWLVEQGAQHAPGIGQALEELRFEWLRDVWNDEDHWREYDAALSWAVENVGGPPLESEEDDPDYWLRFQELVTPSETVDRVSLATALQVACERMEPKWEDRQHEPAVRQKMIDCFAALNRVNTAEDATKWLSVTREVMRITLGVST